VSLEHYVLYLLMLFRKSGDFRLPQRHPITSFLLCGDHLGRLLAYGDTLREEASRRHEHRSRVAREKVPE
jgi:hypothetical protein